MPRKKSWSTGHKGTDRVTVSKHPRSGMLVLTWYVPSEDGRPRARTRSLGHTNGEDAREAAKNLAAELRTTVSVGVLPGDGPLVLIRLFDIFSKAMRDIGKDRAVYERTGKRLRAFFGDQRVVPSLDEHELKRYAHQRKTGGIVLDGSPLGPVRDRVVQEEMVTLRTVLRWAARRRTASGNTLLTADPILSWKFIPYEKNPRRVMLPHAHYLKLLAVSWNLDNRLWMALILAHETGHRLKSLRGLHWEDVDFVERTIGWQGETEKNGTTHYTPLTDDALAALRRYHAAVGSPDTGWLFRGRYAAHALSREHFYELWQTAHSLAKLAHIPFAGFHCFRRRMASDLATAPLAMVQALGGWKHPHVVVQAYQQPNMDQQRAVLMNRDRYSTGT